MRPGDLVRGRAPNGMGSIGTRFRPVTGILLEKIPPTAASRNVWWRVLCEDGSVVEETETYMEVLSETR